MTDTTENTQKFMIKLPPKLHRELMAYAGVKNKALSDILVEWIGGAWENQPERQDVVALVNKLNGLTAAPQEKVATPGAIDPAKSVEESDQGKKTKAPAKAKKAPKEK